MRLAPDKLKTAILAPDQDVRQAAVSYFALPGCVDPEVTRRVIEAIETYGWDKAFRFYIALCALQQTEATVEWFIGQLRQAQAKTSDDESTRIGACACALAHADPTLLLRRRAEICGLGALNDEMQHAIEERIRYLTCPPGEIWREFQELRWEQPPSPCASWNALQRSFRIVEGLARHSAVYAEPVLSMLRACGDEPSSWLDVCAIRLAGEMQLTAAIPCFLDFLEADDLQANLESERALVNLGTNRVIAETVQRYASSKRKYRIGIESILEAVHSDLAVQAACDLLKVEEDREVRLFLIMAILHQFDSRAIDLARHFIFEAPVDGHSAELRPVLFNACKVMERRFPEYDAWLADSRENDGNRRREANLKQLLPVTESRSGDERIRYPVAKVALFGPDDRVTTKIVASVVSWPGEPPVVQSWMGTGVMDSPKVRSQIEMFFEKRAVRTLVLMQGWCNMGCPHEAAMDFPAGQDCPFCPYWKGRQATGAETV
jgi:hypothetical protein